MAYKLMYILNDDTQNYPFCRLQLVVDPFGLNIMNKPIKIQSKSSKKAINLTNKKTLLKIFWDQGNKQPNAACLPVNNSCNEKIKRK